MSYILSPWNKNTLQFATGASLLYSCVSLVPASKFEIGASFFFLFVVQLSQENVHTSLIKNKIRGKGRLASQTSERAFNYARMDNF